MLEAGICDDDRFLLREMEKRLKRLAVKHEADICIETYTDGEDIAEAVTKGKRFDFIYMDIEMKRMNGLEAAQKIREVDQRVRIVFVSSFKRYMKETFQVTPIDFIVKPFKECEFAKVFEHVLMNIRKEDKYYRFQFAKVDYKVPLKDVMYFERKYRITEIMWTGEREYYKLYKDLETIEKELKSSNAYFIRIHKSYLVNYWHIAKFSADFVELMDGTRLPVSRSRKQNLDVIYQMQSTGIVIGDKL